MKRAVPKLKILAARLLEYENLAAENSGDINTTFRVCEKLRQLLSSLAGSDGFRALLSRALSLAQAEAPELSNLKITPVGTVVGLDGVVSRSPKWPVTRGEIILIAHVLGLLATFIGDDLMLRLIQEAWPDAILEESDSEKEENP